MGVLDEMESEAADCQELLGLLLCLYYTADRDDVQDYL
jgi:hypothetical protein